jgi:hypothetical protein
VLHQRALAACVLTALLASVCLILVAPSTLGQRSAGPAQDVASWWPPHPEDQVQYSASVTVPASGGEIEVCTVPLDRWLVLLPSLTIQVTNGSVSASASGTGLLSNSTSNAARLVEVKGGVYVEKSLGLPLSSSLLNPRSAGPAVASPLGWSFSPGSRVALVCPSGMGGEVVSYNFFGYTAPAH